MSRSSAGVRSVKTEDDPDIDQVAAEWLRVFGPDGASELHQRADYAEEIGDGLSAQVWRDIANAVDNLLSRSRG